MAKLSPHLHALSKPLRRLGRELVANHGAFLQGEQQSSQPLGRPGQLGWIPVAALEGKVQSDTDTPPPCVSLEAERDFG